jgi:sodium-dependent dicarboxylate transporter 2/3/5
MFLLRLPLVSLLLILTFKPETRDLSRAISRLRTQVKLEGPMQASGWMTILVFTAVVVG